MRVWRHRPLIYWSLLWLASVFNQGDLSCTCCWTYLLLVYRGYWKSHRLIKYIWQKGQHNSKLNRSFFHILPVWWCCLHKFSHPGGQKTSPPSLDLLLSYLWVLVFFYFLNISPLITLSLGMCLFPSPVLGSVSKGSCLGRLAGKCLSGHPCLWSWSPAGLCLRGLLGLFRWVGN